MVLTKDPLNIIITGVGGQGNVLASQLLGKAFVKENFFVTIGETYGATQRGGAVMSHMRISRESAYSPLIPEGQADIIVALEPVEALRVISQYGNPNVQAIVNSRPIYPTAVTVGDAEYPSPEKIRQTITELTQRSWFVEATEIALSLGSPVYTNIIMLGALAATGLLPLSRQSLEQIIRETFPPSQAESNLQAFLQGMERLSGLEFF
ncbi:MAG: indolepyruvate oxidoreductase subunit beta [Thermodesulfobacteriota bacterium]